MFIYIRVFIDYKTNILEVERVVGQFPWLFTHRGSEEVTNDLNHMIDSVGTQFPVHILLEKTKEHHCIMDKVVASAI